MRSPRVVTSALTAVLALALVAAVPAPAFAAVPPSDDSATTQAERAEGEADLGASVQDSAWTKITAAIRFQETPTSPLYTLPFVSVAIWWLNPTTGNYDPVDVSGAMAGSDLDFVVPQPGDYAIQFLADYYSPAGSEYYDNARYFAEGKDVTVKAGTSVNLGTVVLEPRSFDVGRLAGPDRFATAARISQQSVGDGQRAPVVYIANGYKFPDALAAGPAATMNGGLFLPTAPDYLPTVIADELRRLNPMRVVIAGDEASVSAAVRQNIADVVGPEVSVDRLGGATRYETAALLVKDAFAPGASARAIVATGANFPDALAAGPAAGHLGAPVILVDGAGRLDERTRALLLDLGIEDVMIAGGPTTVGTSLEADLASLLGAQNVKRIAGADRYETASLLNTEVFVNTDIVVLANGYGFIDALAGGPFAGRIGAPLYLSDSRCLPYLTYEGLLVRRASGVWLLGGEPTLSQSVGRLEYC